MLVAATLPDLLTDASAGDFVARGIPAAGGLRAGLLCARALQPGRPAPPRGCARSDARRPPERAGAEARAQPAGWLSTRPRRCCPRRRRRRPGARGRRRGRRGRGGAPSSAGPSRSSARFPGSRTRPSPVRWPSASRTRRRCGASTGGCGAAGLARAARCSSRRWRGAASSCSSRRGATRSCPRSSIGLGGTWAEVLDDAAVVPLPATPAASPTRSARCEARRCSAAGAARPELDVAAAADLAAAAGRRPARGGTRTARAQPGPRRERGRVALDAVAREGRVRTKAAA